MATGLCYHARLRLHQLLILWRSKNSITLNSIQNESISMNLGFIIYRIMPQMCPGPLMGYNRLNNKEKLYCSQMEDCRFYSRRIAFESCLLVMTVRNRDCVLATLTTQFSHSFLLRQQKEQVIQCDGPFNNADTLEIRQVDLFDVLGQSSLQSDVRTVRNSQS